MVVGEVDAGLGEGAGGGGEAGVEELRAEAHGEDLGLGVAEADVVLDEAGLAVGDHQAGVEHALEGGAAAGISARVGRTMRSRAARVTSGVITGAGE